MLDDGALPEDRRYESERGWVGQRPPIFVAGGDKVCHLRSVRAVSLLHPSDSLPGTAIAVEMRNCA